MSRVAVAESILRWAVQRSEQTESDIEAKFPKFGQWLNGEVHPTLAQLEKFAKVTHTPFGFFFLSRPPEEKFPISYFRTVGDQTPRRPSANLMDTLHTMERRQWWMRDYLIEQGHDPLPFVGAETIRTDPKAVAGRMRETLGFEPQWAQTHRTWESALGELRMGMERAGILVFSNGVVGNNTHRKLDVAEFRGFVLVDEYAPLVFINNADAKAAQMFTLAHELAHVFHGSSAAFDLREMQAAEDKTEQACNRAAAEFLVPEDALRAIWSDVQTDADPLQSISRQFKVSALVAARRALDTKLIRRPDFFRFYESWGRDERRRATTAPGGGDFYNNQNLRLGQKFASCVIREAKSGKMPYIEAYRLTQLYGKTFEEYAARVSLAESG